MIWLVFAVLTACVVLAVTHSLGGGSDPDTSASEVEVYKLQLAELDRDQEREVLGSDEADQTRAEISRRLLRANRQAGDGQIAESAAKIGANAAFIGLAAIVAIGSLTLYVTFGAPGMQDQPLEARLNAPPEKQTLDIQIANVERRLRANPKDVLGWSVIAPVYFRLGRFDKAADAFRHLIVLRGEDEDTLLGLAESLTFANDGVVSDQARLALNAALSRNPKSLRGRFWLALLAGQDGKKEEAETIYRQMLAENIPETWKNLVNERLAALNEAPAQAAASENRETSGDALQGEQGAMIRGMVERLAARLKDNKDDLEGWLRLIRSYAVLKDTGKAQEAAASARQQFASDAHALEQIETLTHGLGLSSPRSEGGQPKS
jgi:cytochrome c-type biogenesis protein CcmH